MEEKKSEDLVAQLKEAIELETVPKIYINGFINAYNVADIVLLLKQNQKNVIVVNMSYTTAKSLAEKLSGLIKSFEQKTEHDIMSIDTVKAKLAKYEEKGKGNESLQ